MSNAKYDPKEYKDWLGLAVELEGQGIRLEWSSSGHPEFVCSTDIVYDCIKGVFTIRQRP
jgi:hypothetical protein